MKSLDQMYTTGEVDEHIELIERDMPGLRAKAASRCWSEEERNADLKLGAMCEALTRRTILENEIHDGHREPTGEVIHHV